MDAWTVTLGMQLLTRFPQLLVWVAAIAFAVVRLQQHPKASKLLLAGASICFLLTVVGTFLTLLPTYFLGRGHSPGELTVVLGVLGSVNALLSPLGLGLVVASVFADRQPSTKR